MVDFEQHHRDGSLPCTRYTDFHYLQPKPATVLSLTADVGFNSAPQMSNLDTLLPYNHSSHHTDKTGCLQIQPTKFPVDLQDIF